MKAHEKQKQALALALAGVDYQTIAEKVGYNSRQAAWKAVKSALNKTIKAAAEDVKQMQISRLDTMLKAIWASVVAGNLGVIDRALRLEERRARLLGLDAPIKQEHTGAAGGPIKTEDVTPIADEERINKLVALLDGARARRDRQDHPTDDPDRE